MATDGNLNDDSFCNDFVQAGKGLLDVTFESDIFEFSVTDSTKELDGPRHTASFPRSSSWFPDFSNHIEPTAVDVAIHEQMAATYDDFTQNGAITVHGSIYIRTAATTLEVTIQDDEQCIQQWEPMESICRVQPQSSKSHHKNSSSNNSTTTLRVELKSSRPKDEIRIANYVCSPKLRPVPLVRFVHALVVVLEFAARWNDAFDVFIVVLVVYDVCIIPPPNTHLPC